MDIATSVPPNAADQPSGPLVDGRREEFEANKLRKRLRRQVGEAIGDFVAPLIDFAVQQVMATLSGAGVAV